MKKKFINGLLMAALSVATVGSFVACTDHEDDRLIELQQHVLDDNARLESALQSQIDEINRRLNDLEAAKCTCGDIKAWVQDQLKYYLTIADAQTTYLTKNGALELFYTKAEINQNFYTKAEVNDLLEKYGCKCKEGFTKDEVIDIINTYLLENKYISEDQATTIINNLLKDYYTKTEVENILKNYVTNEYLTQNFYTKEEVLNLIQEITNNFYSKEDINNFFNSYYTKDEVVLLIQKLGGGLTAEQVQAIVRTLLKEYYTKEEVLNLLKNYFTKDEILKLLEEYAKKSDLLTEEEITVIINTILGNNYYNKTEIDELIKNFITQEQMVDYVTKQINNLETKIQNWVINNQFGTGEDKLTIDELVDQFLKLQTDFGTMEQNLKDLTERVKTLEGYYEKYKDLLENLQNTYETVYTWYNTWKDEIINIQSNANYAYEWVKANEELIKALEEKVDSLSKLPHGEGGTCGCDLTQIKNDIQWLKDNMPTECACGLDEDKVKEIVRTMLPTDHVTVGQMNEAIENALKQLKEDVEKLKTDVAQNTEDIKDINEKLKDMATQTWVKEYVSEALAKLVTGITLNAAYSPVLGEGAAPVGLNLNVLAAYHGEALDEISFPDYGSQYLANPVEKVLTQADLDILEKAGFSDYYEVSAGNLYYGKDNGSKANAGKLYFTINPTSTDFTGLTPTVINSRGEKAALELNNVKKSDHKLSWGYTRAGDNGFYEADAEIPAADMNKLKARLDLGAMKDLASDLKDFRTKGFDVTKILSTIYEEAGDVLDRYAVTVESDGRKVVSDYALAATTVKPLGFYSVPLESYKQDNVPGIGRVEKFIDDVKGKVFEALSKVLDKADFDKVQEKIDSFDWSKFTVKDFDEDNALATAVTSIKVDLMNTKDFNETVYVFDYENYTWIPATIYGYAGESYICVELNLYWEIKRLYTDIAEPTKNGIEYVKDFLASKTFQDMLDLLAGLEDRVDGYADRAESFIMKYLNKFNNRMVRFLDPNDYLKTVLLVKDGAGYTRAKMSAKRPTKATTTAVKLMPTTFNADIISPCYKKFVAVTNVWKVGNPSKSAKTDDAECFNELKSANGQAEMMEITEGNKQVIEFTGKTGYVYEILYSALDFNGKNMNNKYYLQF